ncbi:hypothetical protein D9M71_498550 [compost metagenome]
MGEAVEQALAAGLEEALDRGRVAQGIGRRHGLGQQADDELAAADVFRRQVAAGDPVLQFAAPGQVGLHVAAVQGVLAPGRVGEAAVVVGWPQLRGAEQDVLQLQAETGDVPGAVQRLLHRLQQYHAGRSQQVLAANADHGVEVQCVFRGLLGQSVVALLGHGRCSKVLRPILAELHLDARYCSGLMDAKRSPRIHRLAGRCCPGNSCAPFSNRGNGDAAQADSAPTRRESMAWRIRKRFLEWARIDPSRRDFRGGPGWLQFPREMLQMTCPAGDAGRRRG